MIKSDLTPPVSERRNVSLNDLPHWAIPSLGVLLTILFYLFLALGSSLTSQLYPWLIPWPTSNLGKIVAQTVQYLVAFLPVVLLCVVLILLAAVLRRLHPWLGQVRQDWSLLSLMLYPLAMLPILVQDEYQGLGAYQLAGLAILGGGVWVYYRQRHPGWRVFILVAAVALSMMAVGLGIYVLYPQQPWAAHTTFPRWWEALNPFLYGVALMVLLVAPTLLRLLPARATASEVARS
jgi:hypothetical protein